MATRGLPVWPFSSLAPDGLPDPERLLLDAMRRWAAGGPAGPMGEAALLLAAAGLEGAALPLHAAMTALQPWRPDAPLAPRLLPGERAVLLASSELQRNSRPTALALLHGLVPPLAAYRALPPLACTAGALARAGWRFTPAL